MHQLFLFLRPDNILTSVLERKFAMRYRENVLTKLLLVSVNSKLIRLSRIENRIECGS